MNKQNKILIFAVAILGVLVIGATFAAWIVTNKQSTFNTINSGCINLSFNSGNGTLNLQNSAPMTDEDGLSLTGYTFTLTNNCKSEVSYLLNLDLFNVANSTNLTTSEMKLAIDNKVPRKIAYYDDTAKNASSAYGAKTLTSGKLGPRSSETHTVKMWVDENTSNSKQNAVFSNRLFVMASPNLTVPEVPDDDCFVMDGNGTILLYKVGLCPKDIIIPNEIQGETVTDIGFGAFVDYNVISVYDENNYTLEFIIMDEENYDDLTDKLEELLDKEINDMGQIETANTSTYTLTKASEYTHWDDLIQYFNFVDNQGCY